MRAEGSGPPRAWVMVLRSWAGGLLRQPAIAFR